jgi:hypothetical protein
MDHPQDESYLRALSGVLDMELTQEEHWGIKRMLQAPDVERQGEKYRLSEAAREELVQTVDMESVHRHILASQ